jgi:hypothetical protein
MSGSAAGEDRQALDTGVSQPVELGFLGGANDMASVDVRLRVEHYDRNSRRCFGPKQGMRALADTTPASHRGSRLG